MTREEALQWLTNEKWTNANNKYKKEWNEAFDMAIEALSAERTGEWIDKGEYAECSMCGAHSGTQFDGVEPIPLKTNYCPNCGAVMLKGGDTK